MALAALAVEFIFGALHLIPQQRRVQIMEESIHWNYTTVLNIIFLMLAVVLVIRFLRTGGPEMLRMMSNSTRQGHGEEAHQNHGHHA
jgi:hypothetical protein